jgi:hypothetical protein
VYSKYETWTVVLALWRRSNKFCARSLVYAA